MLHELVQQLGCSGTYFGVVQTAGEHVGLSSSIGHIEVGFTVPVAVVDLVGCSSELISSSRLQHLFHCWARVLCFSLPAPGLPSALCIPAAYKRQLNV